MAFPKQTFLSVARGSVFLVSVSLLLPLILTHYLVAVLSSGGPVA
ncbi:MAG: hypothetical protein ACE5HQ_04200 [Gemmatimonadota bacterium]